MQVFDTTDPGATDAALTGTELLILDDLIEDSNAHKRVEVSTNYCPPQRPVFQQITVHATISEKGLL